MGGSRFSLRGVRQDEQKIWKQGVNFSEFLLKTLFSLFFFLTFFPSQTSNNTAQRMERLDRKRLESGAKTWKVIGRTFRLSHSKGPVNLLLVTAAQGSLLVQGLMLAAHHRTVANRDVSQGLTKLLKLNS